MSTFTLYNLEGKEAGTIERPSFFSVPVNEKLIHRYFLWVRTMLRDSVAHTKTRGEVSGGGKKPWKQKGTGRARVGSTRNPVWRHGGIAFGPRNERTFATRMPRAERRKALFSALSSKADNVLVLEAALTGKPSSKQFSALLKALNVDGKKVLHLAPAYDALSFNAARNLSKVTVRSVSRLNIVDVLNHDVLLLSKDSLAALEQHFTPSV